PPGQLRGAVRLDEGAQAVGIAHEQFGGRVLAAAPEATQQGAVAGGRPAGGFLPLPGPLLGGFVHGTSPMRTPKPRRVPPRFPFFQPVVPDSRVCAEPGRRAARIVPFHDSLRPDGLRLKSRSGARRITDWQAGAVRAAPDGARSESAPQRTRG